MQLKEKIQQANEKAVNRIIDSDPVWVDILPAGEAVSYTHLIHLMMSLS